MRTLPPGTAVGPYVVESELARGAMGAVYRARRSHDGALLALKLLDAGPAATPTQQERFRREGELAAKLAHPGIVRVHDAGAISWLYYLAMDLIDGAPLGESAGRLPPLEAARLVAQVARAVEHAHAHGVVHRDLKPSNVLVRRDDGRALVTDFGIAREQGSSALTKTGALVGTPTYFSPEQADGRPATARSDVHALGAILYELLTGAPPFDRDDLAALLLAISRDRPRPPSAINPAVPRALDRACLAALAKSPDARPSAGELAAELEAIVAGRPEPRGAKARWVALGAALAAAGALLLASWPASSPPPAIAPPAPPAAPAPPAPASASAWVEPRWLRAVRARGDTGTLLAALDALDAEPAVDERTRAQAIEALAHLDARWTQPAPLDPDRGDAFDQLLWLHWLWKRLDPTHAPPDARARALVANDMWAFFGASDRTHQARVGLALTAILPQEPAGYLVYSSGVSGLPWTAHDGELLRHGVELAAAQGNGLSWGLLATDYGAWLELKLNRGSPEQHEEARTALIALSRSALTRGALDPTTGAHLLLRGTGFLPREEALAFLDRADALTGSPVLRSLRFRALRLAEDSTALEEAARVAERALDVAVRAPRPDPQGVSQSALLAVDLSSRVGQPARALAALERGLSVTSLQLPGLAMRRVLLLFELERDREDLDAALTDLVTRLMAEKDEGRWLDPAVVTAALDDAWAAGGEPTVGQKRDRLRRWAVEGELRRLDPPDAM
jgi:serine/threonine protein kinase